MAKAVNLDQVYEVILSRMAANPAESYVAQLVQRGEDAVLKKIGEESCEVLLAAKNGQRDETVHELADLWFHLLVLMAQVGIQPQEIEEELGARFGRSGLAHQR